ncbi:hypothetical protein FRB96_003768 [Tulasnella sp. 330]|nr:hypothetical protein FRB96_003768 [Tulasnella sp. 330]
MTSILPPSSTTPPAVTAPNASLILFARGVIAILTTWPVLRIAISEHWGGPESLQKRTWIASEIVDLFEASITSPSHNTTPASQTPDVDDLEDLLLQAMVDEFECEVDDGSVPKVAKEMMDLWKAVKESGELAKETVRTLEARASKVKETRIQAQRVAANDDDDDDDDEMDVDEESEAEDDVPTLQPPKPPKEPEVDQDGFTVVKGKSRG